MASKFFYEYYVDVFGILYKYDYVDLKNNQIKIIYCNAKFKIFKS